MRRILFWFGFAYFLLYSHPFPLGLIPTPSRIAAVFDAEEKLDWITATEVIDRAIADYNVWYTRQERAVVDSTAEHVFGVDYVLDRPYGSGDPLYSYIRLLLHLVTAALLTATWCRLSRSGGKDSRLRAWLLIALRFYVATAMLSYGLSKVLPTQFPPWLRLDRLLAPYGDSSPMNVLWSAMSSSEMYTIFGGAGEVLAGALLIFRRTATLGALMAAGVMANVVAMNFCFDVPVKLYSSHLLLASLAIAAPDVRRLLCVLWWNRPTVSRETRYPHFPWTGSGLKALLIASFVVPGVRRRLEWIDGYDDLPRHYGIWDVQDFQIDGQGNALLATDVGTWKHLVIDRGERCSIHRQDGTRMGQTLSYGDDGSVTLKSSSDWELEIVGDQLLLTGQFAWRFLADIGDKSSTIAQENREPSLRWTLTRATPPGGGIDPTEPVLSDSLDEPLRPWLGRWTVERRDILGDRFTPRRQPAPARFTTLEFRKDGTLLVTLPTGRIDCFRWELTEDRRPTIQVTSTGNLSIDVANGVMSLDGEFRGHGLHVVLGERDLKEFQLLRGGFHWVNPIPWNRY